jgi:hypothetical protein
MQLVPHFGWYVWVVCIGDVFVSLPHQQHRNQFLNYFFVVCLKFDTTIYKIKKFIGSLALVLKLIQDS